MDRRRFLQTAGGVAAVLATIDLAACSSSSPRAAGAVDHVDLDRVDVDDAGPGGSFTVPPPHEVEACEHALGRQRRVRRRRAHASRDARRPVDEERARHRAARARHGARCGASNRLECASRAAYLHDLFLASDTTVAMLSDVPNSGPGRRAGAVPRPARHATARGAAHARRRAARARAQRDRTELRRSQRAPRRDGGDRAAPARSPRSRCTRRGARTVTASRSTIRRSGCPVIQKAHDLGVKIFVAHKGLPLVRLRRGAQPSRRHRRGVPPVPRHAVRRVPRRVGQEPRRRPVRPERDASASTRSCARSTITAFRRTATCGSTSAPCGARCCATRPPPRTRSASC